MQRRNKGHGGFSPRSGSRSPTQQPLLQQQHGGLDRLARSSGAVSAITSAADGGISTWALFLIAVALTTVTYTCFPESRDDPVEVVERDIAMKAYEAEQGLQKWLSSEQDAGTGRFVDDSSNEATLRMLQHESKWVDGEKKLKSKLKELAERQRQGRDLGAPVLTRWIPDVPAWVSEGVDKDEWEKKVKQAYEDMRRAENEWEKKVAAIFEQQEKDRG